MKQKALCWYFDKLHLDNSAEGELCSSVSLWRTFFRNFSRLECTPSLWYLLVGIKQNFASFVNVHSQTRVFEMHKTLNTDETYITRWSRSKLHSQTCYFTQKPFAHSTMWSWPVTTWMLFQKEFYEYRWCKWHLKVIKDYEIISFLRWMNLARASRQTR